MSHEAKDEFKRNPGTLRVYFTLEVSGVVCVYGALMRLIVVSH